MTNDKMADKYLKKLARADPPGILDLAAAYLFGWSGTPAIVNDVLRTRLRRELEKLGYEEPPAMNCNGKFPSESKHPKDCDKERP